MTVEAGNFVLTVASTVVLARLIEPESFGLISMVVAVTNFVKLFNDLGLSQATVQRAEINHNQVSTLFWLNVILSAILMLLTAALAPAIAWFYREPRLLWITVTLACGFIFSGLAVQHRALLNRQMRYGTIAAVRITSLVIGTTTGIVSAWLGADYWALVLMQLTATLSHTVGVWVMCSWRPGLPVWRSNIRSMVAFGSNLTGANLLIYFIRNADNIIIGRYWGAQQLGLYDRAYQILYIPIKQISGPISAVALPALSRLQNDPKRYCAYYYKAILVIVAFGMPLVGFLFVSADKAILTLLGPKWIDTVNIFRALSVATFTGTFGYATGWVYISLGQTDRQLRWVLWTSPVTVLIFLISVPWGVLGVATALSLFEPILQLLSIIYCYKGTPLKLADLIITIARPAAASISAAIVLLGLHQLFPNDLNAFISLLVDGVLYGLFYLAIWAMLPNGRQTLLDIFRLAKELRTTGRKQTK